jgi:hypothetical protein
LATYLQWSRKKTVRPLTWVCGAEHVLAREVVAEHRAGAPPDQCSALFAGEVPERDVWNLLLSVPPPGGRRVTVYGAERLKATGNVTLLATAGELDTAYVTFVSGDDDFARDDGQLAPHLAALQSSRSGQLVRCCAPSSLEDQTALVASWWPGVSLNLAYEVLTRGGGLSGAWLACEQARLAGLDPQPASLAVVCPPDPGGDFTDRLMAGDRAGAAAAARALARGDLGMVIGLLSSRLAAVELVADGTRQGLTPREAASWLKAERFAANRVIPHLARYGPDRVRRCRALLAAADAAWRAGASAGVAESLAALW